MRSPQKEIVPASGANDPAIMLNKVVLPAPFGPITAKISPGFTSRVDAIDREQAAEAFGHAVDLEQSRHGARSSLRRRASHGHTPPGNAITTSRRQTP